MKASQIFIFSFLVLFGVVFVSNLPVGAVETPISPAHIERIRANCTTAQGKLRQLHTSDALLRVNRGQVYESMSAKLMAPMNGRIALNRLDGGELVEIAADYEQTLNDFRSSYQQYERQLSALIELDCVKQPVTFYDQVTQVRAMRSNIHQHVVGLHQQINKYSDAFGNFSLGITKSNTRESDR